MSAPDGISLSGVCKTFTGRGKVVEALRDVTLSGPMGSFTAIIGPSGCGKSTALKCLNRMHDGTRGVHIDGLIEMDRQDIHAPEVDPPVHRRRFGWVAQKPNPFVSSVYDNIAYGARIHGIIQGRSAMDDHVEHCLRRAELWDEVKDSCIRQWAQSFRAGRNNDSASPGPCRPSPTFC